MSQGELRPVLLRRMKEDVENLPDKEEVVVWVQLTTEQRHFYKAIFGKEVCLPWTCPQTLPTVQLLLLSMALVIARGRYIASDHARDR